MQYTIQKNGDSIERESWKLFAKTSFPSYEKFWQSFVVPLTQRPRIRFKQPI